MEDLRVWLRNFVEAEGVLSQVRAHQDEAARLERESLPKCGNCDHWMKKSSCPREARGEKPSTNHPKCSSFAPSTLVAELKARAASERRKATDILIAYSAAKGDTE